MLRKIYAMVVAVVAMGIFAGCGQAIPQAEVYTKKLDATPVVETENVITETIEVENIETEEMIEEEETKRELNGVLRFVNDKGNVLFYMATYDEYFTIDKSLDDLVETLNEECEETYIRMEENGKFVVKSINEKKEATNIWMVTVVGDENDF